MKSLICFIAWTLCILYTFGTTNAHKTNWRHRWPTAKPRKSPSDILPQDILNSAQIGKYLGFVRDKWKYIKPLLHPTQPDVGYAWVIRKVNKDFNSQQNAQKEMNPVWSDKWPDIDKSDLEETANTIPCIIGPTQNNEDLRFYVIDSHHTLSALDYSQLHETYVYLNILFDFRTDEYDEFVAKLKQQKNTFLYSQKGTKKQLPTEINFNDLPHIFDFNRCKKAFYDSTWRSLGGYSRKVKVAPYPFLECSEEGDSENCMRPFVRICDENGFGIPFYEFIWGFFYVDATYISTTFWDGTLGEKPLETFNIIYNELLSKYYDKNGNWIDPEPQQFEVLVEDWLFGASHLVPLARGQMTANYKPLDFFERDSLPGYVQGIQKVPDDPDCKFSTPVY